MSFTLATGRSLSAFVRSYLWRRTLRQITAGAICVAALFAAVGTHYARPATIIHIVALGDSLTSGIGVSVKDGFVLQLQALLAAKGIDADIANAGVVGDGASEGLARLDRSVPLGTDAVIVELGANDMLRRINPEYTRKVLGEILRRLTERHIAVLLCGMLALPDRGTDYVQAFERIYPDLAVKYGVLFYPFFLDGVWGHVALVQRDGRHPNAAGVSVIVERILPKVQELVARVRSQHQS